MSRPKLRLKNLLASCGWEVKRFHPTISDAARISTIIEQKRINCVYDVGANTGQFAIGLRSLGYTNHIISFEPLESAHKQLLTTAKDDSNWTIHSRAAVGSTDEITLINIAGNSASSSLLPMLDSHVEADPSTAYIGNELVPMVSLDTLKALYISNNTRLLLKVDTQGYEAEVFKGASETLDIAEVIICELSLAPLYEGQSPWIEIIQDLALRGFHPWSLTDCFVHPVSGRVLQIDVILVRD
jgi:FkbM family methyltransferase